MSVGVRYVVGQFVLGERHAGTVHPLLAGGRTVRVHVGAAWQVRVRLSRNHPRAVVELVPVKMNKVQLEKKYL